MGRAKFNHSVSIEMGAQATCEHQLRCRRRSRRRPPRRLDRYISAVITDKWPAIERSKASSIETRALDTVYAALLTFNSGDRRGTALLAEALHQLDIVTQARRAQGLSWPRASSPGCSGSRSSAAPS